ncbi:hypothetical protein C7E13_10730 [Stenotrophomonas maltophilia]|nr:hypothetical protein C7E13_10730 [Stenotrophomonas maltophilia]
MLDLVFRNASGEPSRYRRAVNACSSDPVRLSRMALCVAGLVALCDATYFMLDGKPSRSADNPAAAVEMPSAPALPEDGYPLAILSHASVRRRLRPESAGASEANARDQRPAATLASAQWILLPVLGLLAGVAAMMTHAPGIGL